MTRQMTATILIVTVLAATVPGCLFTTETSYSTCSDDDNCLKIAFEVKEEYQNIDENPQKLADRLGELMGQEVEIYPVNSQAATIEALRFGNADIGFLDGGAAWLSWQEYGLEVAAAEQKGDGRAYYNAIAWVHIDSDMAQADLDDDPATDPFDLMQGKISCHTSALGSSGMLLPMGYLINNGYVDVVGDPNEIDSLHATVSTTFPPILASPIAARPTIATLVPCAALQNMRSAMQPITFRSQRTQPSPITAGRTRNHGALRVISRRRATSTPSWPLKALEEPPATR